MPIFRYSPCRYTDSLFSLGLIRIGTLHDFRKSEHKQGIADSLEGKKTVVHHIGEAFFSDQRIDNNHASALKAFRIMDFDNKSEPFNIFIGNATLSQEFDYPDRFIMCFSDIYSSDTMSLFEGADSCYHIQHVDAFINILTHTLNAIVPVRCRGVHKVTYTERNEEWNGLNWGRPPSLIKEPKFSAQSELRVIWEPLNYKQQINPIIISNYRLISICNRLANPRKKDSKLSV